MFFVDRNQYHPPSTEASSSRGVDGIHVPAEAQLRSGYTLSNPVVTKKNQRFMESNTFMLPAGFKRPFPVVTVIRIYEAQRLPSVIDYEIQFH